MINHMIHIVSNFKHVIVVNPTSSKRLGLSLQTEKLPLETEAKLGNEEKVVLEKSDKGW